MPPPSLRGSTAADDDARLIAGRKSPYEFVPAPGLDLPDDFGTDDPDGNRIVIVIITAALFITIAGSAALLWSFA